MRFLASLGMTKGEMIVEICANGFESARIAQDSGADRIELCEDLLVGGVTPSRGLIRRVMKELDIPTHVLIRPRGGDFLYSEEEFESMLSDIAFCKEIGCDGVVSGVLTTETEIDVARTERLIFASEGMEFTFHRAFDYCKEPLSQLQVLIKLGVTRVLTSGQAVAASEGIELLKELKADSKGKIQIMPGGGINSNNVLKFSDADFEMIHFSAIKKIPGSISSDLLHNKVEGYSDSEEIKKVIELLA